MGVSASNLAKYESKRIDPKQFPDLVQNGDIICNAMGSGAASRDLFDPLVERYEEFENVTYQDEVQVKDQPFLYPDIAQKISGHIKTEAWYVNGPARKVAASRWLDYRPIMTEDCVEAITKTTNILPFMCTPPNEDGMVNLSTTNFFTKDVLEYGREIGGLRLAIAEINEDAPVIYGDNWVSMDKIDYFYEKKSPLLVLPPTKPNGKEQTIANNALELIRDRDCIQIGIGSITEAVAANLTNFKDLGINSEMFPAGMEVLMGCGAVTNAYRQEKFRGKSTATLILGSRALYDFCTENENVELYPCGVVNHPSVIMQDPQVTAINMGLMVDLSGQISSESMGYRQVSGPGGQLDFAIGAHWSKGGKSLVLMTSARELADGGIASSIVPSLPEGTTVTVPRMFAEYVVTEYGVANLRGKSRQERARELIAVAHPDARAKLREAALSVYWPDGADDILL